MDTQKRSTDEVLEAERSYWRALQSQDTEAAMRLTADPCVVTGAQGYAAIDRKTFETMSKNAGWKLERWEFLGEPDVRLVSPDCAVVAYKVREEMTVDGKPVTMEAADASTWVRRDGQWKCVLHTEAVLGDPFGRDRKH